MDKIDGFSSLAFPSLFGLFNIVYWWYYLTASAKTGYFDPPT